MTPSVLLKTYLFTRELKTFFGADYFLEKDSQQLFFASGLAFSKDGSVYIF